MKSLARPQITNELKRRTFAFRETMFLLELAGPHLCLFDSETKRNEKQSNRSSFCYCDH